MASWVTVMPRSHKSSCTSRELLGMRKVRCLPVRFLTLPVEHRACDFHRTRRSTFGRSPWLSMKRLFPFPQLHSAFPMDSLRVR